MNSFCSGFVSLVGRPNVGKSTLLNQLAGMRLAITSPKPQTTRNVIRGIIDSAESQIIFLDTPGMHEAKNRLGSMMVSAIESSMADTDIIVLMVDAKAATAANAYAGIPRMEAELIVKARKFNKPLLLVLNKVDQVVKEKLLPLIELYKDAADFQAIIPLSARTGEGMESFLGEVRRILPPGPRLFPPDTLTDQTERDLAAEIIRERILHLTHQEIPHGTAVEIEQFREEVDPEQRKMVQINAVIYCIKPTHKGIIIGRGGQMLKKIGTEARLQIEEMLGCPVYLELFVKVREDWQNRIGILRNLGLTE